MPGRRPLVLAVSLALGACAGELAAPQATMLPASPAVAAPALLAGVATSTRTSAAPPERRARPRKDRGPGDRDFVISHFSAGAFGTIVISPATYFLAAKVV